jgi:hypothetical protein
MINITSITLLVPLNLSNPTHQGTMEMCKDCTGCFSFPTAGNTCTNFLIDETR